ncbi:Cation-independent mannose-6-phosphate receptor [Amphibalanus amphitrite]|uniref:Cation-independent mannose-6-phosphate receptor n=1 Tax=Amphibalanus amphitrite TaxID=1232801 RepID=A0A6A4XC17_AMPAM|nr:Cation-independent mannose-6-phosphate receptor [Amphibalanus amphitrite]
MLNEGPNKVLFRSQEFFFQQTKVVVDVSALTRGVRLLSVEVPLTAVPAGPAASPAADIERGTCPPPFGPLQLLQSAAQLSVSRGLQRSGVPQLIQQLNEPPSPAAAEGAAPRRPGDVSTPGISGFCLADRQLHLLFAEGRADAELEQTAAAPRALPRRDARLCHHSGLLFRERLYPRQPAVFRVLEDRPLRAQLLDTRLYTLQKQEPARAVRAIRECFRTQWLAALGPVSVSARWSGRPVVAAVQLCAAGPCAAPSAACVTSGDGQPLVADAGRLTNSTALVVKDSSQLQLDLAPGQPCSSQGRNTTFNTTVLFVCDPSDQESERQRPLAVFGDCSLTVIWYTAGACGRPAAAPAACPLLAYGPLRSRPGLAGLASARWSAVGAGVSVQARLCGGGDGPCAGAPLCVTAGGRAQAVGSADRPPRLAATANGSVTLTYGPSDGERAEVALRCREEAGAGRLLVVGRRQPRLLQLALETAVVCPVRRVDCRVTAEDGTVRDLSALSLETGAWETADRAAGRAGDRFFINMCRALGGDSGAALCGGVAGTAVCLRAETGDPVSLGAVAGPPSRMADGSISIVYSNGSACGGGRYSSELQLVCGPLRDGAPLLLGRAHCRFTFLWETAVACGRQESSGGRCAVVEPLYGHRLDVSALRRPDSDYALPLDGGGTLYLNLCGPLVRRCAGAAGQGACLLHANGTELSYGEAGTGTDPADGTPVPLGLGAERAQSQPLRIATLRPTQHHRPAQHRTRRELNALHDTRQLIIFLFFILIVNFIFQRSMVLR